jgi:hypothetical protein
MMPPPLPHKMDQGTKLHIGSFDDHQYIFRRYRVQVGNKLIIQNFTENNPEGVKSENFVKKMTKNCLKRKKLCSHWGLNSRPSA